MIVVYNEAIQRIFLKSRFVIFKCQKICKKGYIEMTKKFYLETFKKCAGLFHFILLARKFHFPKYQKIFFVKKISEKAFLLRKYKNFFQTGFFYCCLSISWKSRYARQPLNQPLFHSQIPLGAQEKKKKVQNQWSYVFLYSLLLFENFNFCLFITFFPEHLWSKIGGDIPFQF